MATEEVIGWKDLLRPTLVPPTPTDAPKTGEVVGTVGFVIPPGDVVERWRPLVCSYSWPCQQAMAVLRCESTGNPRAVSPGGHLGLFQMAPMHAARVGAVPSALLDPEVNVRAAFSLWREQGWRPWSCRP